MMGCERSRSSSNLPSRADILELQKHPEELHERRLKILQWMADGTLVKMDKHTQIDEKLHRAENHWQEAWQRERELVAHPSRIDSCESKMICITMVDEKLRLACDEDTDTATSWNELESMSH